jgi:biotin carboxylase
MSTVIIIASRRNLLAAAVDLGLTPVLVRGPGQPDDEQLRLAKEVACTDLFDEDGVVAEVERLYHRYGAARVLSLSEDGLLPAARVNERHGLGGNSLDCVRLLKDKSAMRRRLAEVGLSPVRNQVVGSAGELAAFAGMLGQPVIVKPLDAGGSAGIHLLEEPDQAAAVWSAVRAGGRERMLAEEYLDGPEISVEAFSDQGRHTVVALTQKLLGPRFIEVGHIVPARLDSALRQEVVELTVALLDSVGLTEGPSHTEMKLTSAGPRIVESHNRIGGDNITDLVHAVYGVDFERLAVGVPLGLLPWPGTVPTARGGAAIRFLTPPPGTVRAVHRPRAGGSSEPGVDGSETGVDGSQADGSEAGVTVHIGVRPGDTIRPLTWSVDRVAGHVMATGTSGPDALERCERTLAGVRVEITPEP